MTGKSSHLILIEMTSCLRAPGGAIRCYMVMASHGHEYHWVLSQHSPSNLRRCNWFMRCGSYKIDENILNISKMTEKSSHFEFDVTSKCSVNKKFGRTFQPSTACQCGTYSYGYVSV